MLEKIQFMITGELKSKVDKICETFLTGGLTNPLEVKNSLLLKY